MFAAAGAATAVCATTLFQPDRTTAKCEAQGSRLLPSELLSDGCIHDSYEISEELGSGGFATVFRAEVKETGVKVAVKRMIKADQGFGFQSDVTAEVAILRRIGRHGRMVSLVDCYEDDKNIYVVLELCHGGDLFDWFILDQEVPEYHWAILVREMLKAIAHCHDKGVLHLDVKPENFMLSSAFLDQLIEAEARSEGLASDKAEESTEHKPAVRSRSGKTEEAIVKLADFGLAKFLEVPAGYEKFIDSAREEAVGGTLKFMAPETLQSKVSTLKSDVWSLGISIFLMRTFTFPFKLSGAAEVPRHSQKQYPKAFAKGVATHCEKAGVGPACTDLLQKMLQYDPENRISIEEALQHPFLNGDNVHVSAPEDKQKRRERRIQSQEEQAVLKTKGTKLQEMTLNPGEALFSKGDLGDDIYLTLAGTFEVWDDDLFICSVPAGDSVGEIAALLHPGTPRVATVRCRGWHGPCVAMRMPPAALASLKKKNPMIVKRFQERADQRDMQLQALHWLLHLPLFDEADPEFVRLVAQNMRPETAQKGEVLMFQGEPGEEMYILRCGALDVHVADEQPQHDTPESYGQVVSQLEAGAMVGEISIVLHRPAHSATVVASQRSDLLMLTRGQFMSLLDQFPNEEARIKKMAEQRLQTRQRYMGALLEKDRNMK